MTFANRKVTTVLATATLFLFLAAQYAEARRGGGGGGRGMMRGGPAASGSFNRARARPSRSYSTRQMNRRGATYGTRRDRSFDQDRMNQRQDRLDERQQNRQDRYDQRQENIKNRQDLAKEVHKDRKEYYDDRKEWYEDRWRRGTYISVSAWGSMGCLNDPVLIGAEQYYECRGVRYQRVYRGGEVVFVVVN